MPETMRRAHVLYSGKVQGVGFRYTTRQIAARFAVTGFVKNLGDGRVELVAEGTQEEVERFLRAIRQSDLGPLIGKEEASWSAYGDAFDGFEIAG